MSKNLLLISADDYVKIIASLPHSMTIVYSDGTEVVHTSTVENTPVPNIIVTPGNIILTGPSMPISSVTLDGSVVDLTSSDVEYVGGAEYAAIDMSLKSIIAHREGEFE